MLGSSTSRLVVTVVAVAVVAALIALYVAKLLESPPTVEATTTGPTAQLTLKTEAAVGPQGGNKSWVSYLIKNPQGEWVHSTIFKVPAHSLVRVTVYQFDGESGLRNPFLSQVHGTVGDKMRVNGKLMDSIDPEEASHTFAVPQMGLIVPLIGVPEEAPNQCEEGPCSLEPGPRDDHLHVPHRQAGALPLAVLRALRRRLPLRLRRTDADDRLHGRIPPGGVREAPSVNEPNHFRRIVIASVVLSAIATPIVVAVIAPTLPPGKATDAASGQVFDNTVLFGIVTPIAATIVVYFAYSLFVFRRREEGTAGRGRDRGRQPRPRSGGWS